MIVCKLFDGDRLDLANMQQEIYGESLAIIMDAACSRLRAAQAVLRPDMELLGRTNQRSFDHRTIQYFHDAISGQFRYRNCRDADLWSQNKEPLSLWRKFLRSEIGRLLDRHPLLTKMIATAAFFPNPDPLGMRAEEYLYELAAQEYPHLQLEPQASKLDDENDGGNEMGEPPPILWTTHSLI